MLYDQNVLAEEQYKILFESNPQPMFVYDMETLKFLAVNNAAVEKYGYSKDEFYSKTIKDIRPSEDVESLLKNVSTHKEKYQFSSGWRHIKKNGSVIDVEILSHEIFFNERKARFVSVNDVTEKKKIEQALTNTELRYRNTLDHMLEGFQLIGYDWRYLYINDVAAKHGRSTKEELLGHTIMEKYPGIEKTKMFLNLKRCMEERIPCNQENEFSFPDGSKSWFYLQFEPVPDGVIILSSDITKEKEAEQELKMHREHLEELVDSRTKQLEAVNKELEAFSYSVSHDLRAPLRHIAGFIELLQKDISESLNEKHKRYFNNIVNSVKRMGTLIDDLLSFSRMGRVEMHNSKVNLNYLIKESVKDLSDDLHGRYIDWEIAEMPVVEGDPAMLKQVIWNLISNAVKFTKKTDDAIIQIGYTENEGECIYFVKDNGAGFEMKYVDKLFGVFQRLHSNNEFEGTGIGLANVKRIIHRHGGRVWAEGEIKKGATIYFTINNVSEGKND